MLDGNLSLDQRRLFQIEKDNTRSQISTGVYELTGDVRVRGFQAERARAASRRDWQVFGGYTYLDAEIVKASVLDNTQGQGAGEHADRTARRCGRPTTSRANGRSGTGIAYMSDRYASNTNAVKVADYFRWDAMVAYHAAEVRRSSSTCSTSPIA